jgi:bifunctional DNA-binding transcriptional regulator/antitoxin component of YhaV-PrlF toxin-antitoxin module
MSTAIQFRQRGTLTFPTKIRKKYNIQAGDTYHLVDLDGIFVLTPMKPMVPELAAEIERLLQETGASTDDLLLALREERARYVTETYGDYETEDD